jgi:hypothetical protein
MVLSRNVVVEEALRPEGKDTAVAAMMVAIVWRGCHFGDKSRDPRSTGQTSVKTGRSAPGRLAD